jgi:phospholipid/cholesterol/gamma-HCH transport system substrate-binding protein
MGRTFIETIMGAVVLLVAAIFLVFAYSQANLGAVKGYSVSADFANVGGLPNGGEVRINGIKVGTVTSQSIDTKNFDAVVRMSIMPDVRLPDDTVASVANDGLLGGKYVRLDPGSSSHTIPPDGTITHTKNYQSLEEMVGEIIFLATDTTPSKGNSNPEQPSANSPNPSQSQAQMPQPGESKDK